MKSFKLTVMHVEVIFDSGNKKLTFVTPNASLVHIAQIAIPVKIINEEIFTIKSNNPLYLHCEKLFSTIDYVKYEGFIPFDGDINKVSFSTEILLNEGLYKPKNKWEEFLASSQLLKNYYKGNLTFGIKNIREEYSREFGTREFTNQYQTNKINPDLFQKKSHSNYIYTSSNTSKLTYVQGIKDNGQKFIEKNNQFLTDCVQHLTAI
jgi:hypothetical protein